MQFTKNLKLDSNETKVGWETFLIKKKVIFNRQKKVG